MGPARRCAQAAQGSEVEVCVRLAVENPEATEEIVSALIAHVDRTEAPERALLDALLQLLSEQRLEGASTLGALDDPRTVPVLIEVARSEDLALSQIAIEGLAARDGTLPLLGKWLVDRGQPLERRVAIARALGRSARPTAIDTLQDALRRRMPGSLRAEITAALAAAAPERLEQEQQTPSADGALWLAGGSSVILGYAMGAAAALGDAGAATGAADGAFPVDVWTVAAATGAVGGASGGWLYARAFPMEAGDAAFVTTSGTAGGLAGFLIGAGLRRGESFDPALIGGLLGESIAFPVALLLQPHYDGDARDVVEAVALAGLVTAGTESFAQFLEDGGNDVPRAAVTGGALAAGLVVGHALAPRVDATEGLGVVGLSAAAGAAAGLLAPIGDRPRSLLPVGTALVGAGIGGLLAPAIDVPNDVALAALGGATIGAGIGGGLGLFAAPNHPDVARGLALGAATLGFGAGSSIAAIDPDPVDDRDVVIAVAASGWAAWDAVAVGLLLGGGESNRQGTGALLLASSLAGGGAIALNGLLDVPVPHTLSATSVGLWGGYAGAALAELTDADPIALALPGSNLGLIAGALLVSPEVEVPPLVIGVADTVGVLGASVAGIGASLVSDRPETAVGWSLGGAALGLAGGAVLGTVWYHSGERRDVAWTGPRVPRGMVVQVAPMAVSRGYGLTLRVDGW